MTDGSLVGSRDMDSRERQNSHQHCGVPSKGNQTSPSMARSTLLEETRFPINVLENLRKETKLPINILEFLMKETRLSIKLLEEARLPINIPEYLPGGNQTSH